MEHTSIDYAVRTAALISGLYIGSAIRPEEMGETNLTLRLQTRYRPVARTTSTSRPIRPYVARRTILTTVTRKPSHETRG